MKEIDTGREKVKKICDVLRRETIEPAKQEADEIIRQAKLQAAEIIKSAKEESEKIKSDTLKEMEKQKIVFLSSLQQAGKQSVEALKNEIESKLFDPALSKLLNSSLTEKKVVVDLIQAVISALKKDGVDADLDISIPPVISIKDVNDALIGLVGENVKSYKISLGSMQGGIAVKLVKENITIDITDQALEEWVSKYVRQDFRKILFGVK
ncbi:MAG: V-type ATP synthase subunit E [Verrucomicrobia bacterium]|nr:V-type ATP synthase subunit E [Verrucomicrobiota bacterium]